MSISKASSKAKTSSTRPSESAPRSSMNVDSGLMSFSSTSSCSLMIRFTSAVTFRPSAMMPPGAPPTREVAPFAGIFEPNYESVARPSFGSLRIRLRTEPKPKELHVHAAVYSQRLARDVASLVGGQVHHGSGDLFRLAGAAERNGRVDRSLLLFGERPGHVGVDEARRDGVDGDGARRQLAGHRLGDAEQGGLGGSVGGLPGVAHLSDHAGQEDDAAGAGAHHDLRGGARAGERALHVHGQDAIEVFVFEA